jgi:hypothetical protein
VFAVFVLMSGLLSFADDPESSAPYVNPLANRAVTELLEPIFIVIEVAFPVLVVLCFASLAVRFRRAGGVERQQLKLFAFAAAFLALYLIVDTAIADVIDLPDIVTALAFAAVPASVGVAILRYRLYDIDLIINRTLVYGALSAVLAAIYVGLVFGFQAVLAPFTNESDIAIAASTLAVAAMFRPLRSRLQGFIDHRFYRRKFDAHQTLEDFTEHLRDEVDITALSSRLTDIVGETMQPAHVSLWLRGATR